VHSVLVVLIAAAVVMTLVWEIQRRTRNAGYVDAAWSFLMGGAAVYYNAIGPGAALPRALTATLGALWGFRLGLHILHRMRHEAEDGRYRHLRERIRGHQGKFFAFFMFQAGLTALFSLPFYVASRNPQATWTPWLVAGVVVWLVGVGGESLADRQLARFRADPANRGTTCRAGLWRYSRHPNYFFEWLHWFAYVGLAVGAPAWGWSLLGPALMLVSLCWVTGIPFVEAQALRSRGDDYRRYQRETSVFVPWFPRAVRDRDSAR
jgi:steroid 5-alpha reductase family enzyme